MELDRHFIERKDFSVARRGYEPQEVDLHLRELADTSAELRAQLKATPAGIAGAAAEQVRQIVEAAEESAAAIEQRATDEATRMTEDASKRARDTRERADAESAEQLARVQETAAKMLDRAGALEQELDALVNGIHEAAGGLVQSMREGAGELDAELESIRGELLTVRPPEPIASGPIEDYDEIDEEEDEDEEIAARGSWPSAAERVSAPSAKSETKQEALPSEPEIAESEREPEPEPEPAAGPAPGVGGAGPEGARLVALNMALNGTPREEAARYLADNFQLDDQESILDDVYSRVGGRN
ncbi:MAG: DivIVA domain-containing protein [Thermoleophilaceae bacterium]